MAARTTQVGCKWLLLMWATGHIRRPHVAIMFQGNALCVSGAVSCQVTRLSRIRPSRVSIHFVVPRLSLSHHAHALSLSTISMHIRSQRTNASWTSRTQRSGLIVSVWFLLRRVVNMHTIPSHVSESTHNGQYDLFLSSIQSHCLAHASIAPLH